MKDKQLFMIISLVATNFAKNVIASESYDNRWYVSPSDSYLWLDNDRMISRNGYVLNLAIGKAINKNVNLEVKGIYNRYQHQSNNSYSNKF